MATQGKANRHTIVQSMGLGDRKVPAEPVASPPIFTHRMSYTRPSPELQGRPRNDSNASRATSVSQRTARRQGLLDGATSPSPPSLETARRASTLSPARAPSDRKRASIPAEPAAVPPRPSLSGDRSSRRTSAQIERNTAPSPAPALPIGVVSSGHRASISREPSKRKSIQVDTSSAISPPLASPISTLADVREGSVRRRSTQVDRTSRRESLQLGRPSMSQTNLGSMQTTASKAGVIPFDIPVLQESQTTQQPAKSNGGFLSKLFGKSNGSASPVPENSQAPLEPRGGAPRGKSVSKSGAVVTAPAKQRSSISLKDRRAAKLTAAEGSDGETEFQSVIEPSVVAAPPTVESIVVDPETQQKRGALRRLTTMNATTSIKAADVDSVMDDDTKQKKRLSFFGFGRKPNNAIIVDDTRRRRYNAPAARKPSAGSVISVGGMTDLAYVSDESRSVISTVPLGIGRMSAQTARARRHRTIDPDDTIQEADEEAESSPAVSRRVSRERPRNNAKNRSSMSRDRPLSPITAKAPAATGRLSSDQTRNLPPISNTIERGWTDDEDDFEEANDDEFSNVADQTGAEPADVLDHDDIAPVLLRGQNIATLGRHLSTSDSQKGNDYDAFTELSAVSREPEREPERYPIEASAIVAASSQTTKSKRVKSKALPLSNESAVQPVVDRKRSFDVVSPTQERSLEPEPEVQIRAASPLRLGKTKKKKKSTTYVPKPRQGQDLPQREQLESHQPVDEDEELPVYNERLAKSAPLEKVESKGKTAHEKSVLAGMGGLIGGALLGSGLGNGTPKDKYPDEKSNGRDLPVAQDPANYDNADWGSEEGEDDYFSDKSDSEAAVVAADQEAVPSSSPRGSNHVRTFAAPPIREKRTKAVKAAFPPTILQDDDSVYDELSGEESETHPPKTTSSQALPKRKAVPQVAPYFAAEVKPSSKDVSKQQQTAAASRVTAKEVLHRPRGSTPEEDHYAKQLSRFKSYSKKPISPPLDSSPTIGEIYHDPARRTLPESPTRPPAARQNSAPRKDVPNLGAEVSEGAPLSRTKSPPAPVKPQKSSARASMQRKPSADEVPPSRPQSLKGSLRGKRNSALLAGAGAGAVSAVVAKDRRGDDPAVLSDDGEVRFGDIYPLKRQSSNRQAQRSSILPASRKPSKRAKATHRDLTPTQRHYLLKSLVCIQMQSEWEDLEKLGALTQYGFPFSLDRPELTRVKLNLQNEYTSGGGMEENDIIGDPYANEDGDEARRRENLQQPYILRHLFHTHLTTFPGLTEAPVNWWQQRIQVFFDEMAARNFSTSLERSEYSRRRFFSLALTRYLGVYFTRGIGVRGRSELRGPGPGEPGSEKWGVGKQWGKGTVKRGLDQPVRIDPALWKKIDNLFGEGPEGDVWRQAGKESTRIRGDWQAWKENIIENEDGLDDTIDFLDVSKIRNLPPKYRNAEEWARNHAAYLLHSLFVSSPQADSVFGVVKGIHTLFPYWGAKQLLKYANAQVLIEGILNLLLARPAGAKSLIQRIAAYVIGTEATTLQKDFITPMKKELADKDLTNRIDDYVLRCNRPERHLLRSRAEKTGDDILTVILLAAAGSPLSREVQDQVIKMQHAFARSPYRGDIDLAYPASAGYGKANPDKVATVPTWDASRAEADAARKYAQLKLYLRDCLKKRDREEAVKMASGSLLPTIIKETLSIVFYDAIKEIAKVADLSARLGDLQAFVDDMIELKKKKDDSIQAWIALAARHENSLYYVIHECNSIAGPLWKWAQIGLDFMALSTSDPVHPADRSAKNLEVDLEEMLKDGRLTDRDVDLILEEVDELAVYTKWTKVAYELQLRQNYLLARPDAATASQLTEEDIPTDQMKEEIRDIDTLMRELMEEEGVPIDDGALPNESRGTEAREQAHFWFDAMDPLGQHLKAERESEELHYQPLGVTPPIPCLKYIRKLLPVFHEVLKEKLPDWEQGDADGPGRVKSPASEREAFMDNNRSRKSGSQAVGIGNGMGIQQRLGGR